MDFPPLPTNRPPPSGPSRSCGHFAPHSGASRNPVLLMSLPSISAAGFAPENGAETARNSCGIAPVGICPHALVREPELSAEASLCCHRNTQDLASVGTMRQFGNRPWQRAVAPSDPHPSGFPGFHPDVCLTTGCGACTIAITQSTALGGSHTTASRLAWSTGPSLASRHQVCVRRRARPLPPRPTTVIDETAIPRWIAWNVLVQASHRNG